MTVNENRNTAREDGAAPVPPNPEVVEPPPPEETERMNLDGDTSGTTPPGSNHDERNEPMTDDTKWIPVIRDDQVRQERRMKAAENTITGLIAPPPSPPTRMNNVPLPPIQLYKEDTTTVTQDEQGVIVSYSKINFSQRFTTSKSGDIFPGKTYQSLIGSLQKADKNLMICPLAPTHDSSSNYIDQTCHIPVADEFLLRNYLPTRFSETQFTGYSSSVRNTRSRN